MKLYWVTNIPTPYRNHRYRTMMRVLPARGIDFEVLYMATTEHNRHWDLPADQFAYPYTIFRGLHPVFRGWTAHFNPGLLARLARKPADIVLIGGFTCPTHWLASTFCPPSTLRVMMVESNLDSARHMSRAARAFKRHMLLSNVAFIVTGPRSREYIEELAPEVANRPFFEFPNLVEESVWIDAVNARRAHRTELRQALGVGSDTQLWVCPARLHEDKGLHLFLPALAGLSGFRLLIAGEGPLQRDLERVIAQHALPVTLLGHQSQSQMVDLYAAADVFALPSLRDPSPLSAVEACAASLPLLVSSRIGNLDDVLDTNGESFDITSPESIRAAASNTLQQTPSQLAARAAGSFRRHQTRFNSVSVVSDLADFLNDLRSCGNRPSP